MTEFLDLSQTAQRLCDMDNATLWAAARHCTGPFTR